MIDINTRLKKSYDDVQISRMLYDNIPFYRRLDFWVLVVMGLTGGIVWWLTLNIKYSYLYVILYLFSMIFGGFLIINRGYKKRLIKENIPYDDEILKHWAGEGYQKKKIERFYEVLIDRELLHNSQVDIDLIIQYEKLCESESNFFKKNQNYLFGGGVLVLFILPVWVEVIKVLLSDIDNYIENIKLIISFLGSIGLIIYILSNIDKALLLVFNSTSRKYTYILKLLRLVRINLIIKYTKPKRI